MLSYLSIENFALIKEAKLELSSGLNILTGETGAGKSIIIKALDMLLGGRAYTDFIRTGEEKAIIEASFKIEDNQEIKSKLDELGLELSEDANLILSREISHAGNNKSRINGRIATLEMTRQISKYLIDIHGQHEHQSLLDQREHLNLLDKFGGDDLLSLRKNVNRIYKKLAKKKNKLKKLNQDQREREREIDLLKFQLNEIEEVDLKIDEDEKLMAEKKKLSHAEQLSKVIGQSYNQLYESDLHQSAIIDQVNQITKDIESLVSLDQNLEEVAQLLKNISYELEEASFELRDYQEEIEFDPQRLNIVEERLNLINGLKRKYGDTIEEILEYAKKNAKKLNNLENNEELKEELELEVEKIEKDYLKRAEKLSSKRKEVAAFLENKVIEELIDLSMAQTKFKVDFKRENNFRAKGIDKIEFLISPNPGADLKPLVKIASGGELSRIMLALKTITANIDEIDILVFDEIDTGIGGRIAKLLANKLSFLATKHQLICITHLPQIACMADNHYLILKKIVDQKTETALHQLNDNARIRELARMLDGSLNDTTLEHARELIESAGNKNDIF